MLYVMGLAVLLLLGMISGEATNRAWIPDAANLQYEQFWKLKGGTEAISNRADMLGVNLLALGAQYGWQLAGMMLMGAALMRTGWLKGEFSLRHYRRTGAGLVLLGVLINLPAVMAQWHIHWDYRWCAFLLQVPRELSAPFQTIGYAALIYGFWPAIAFSPVDGQRYRLRGPHGVEQLPPANADLHHAFLSLWPVYEIRPPYAAGVCYSGLGW